MALPCMPPPPHHSHQLVLCESPLLLLLLRFMQPPTSNDDIFPCVGFKTSEEGGGRCDAILDIAVAQAADTSTVRNVRHTVTQPKNK